MQRKPISQQTDQQVVTSQTNKADKKIATQDNKMNSYLTWDKAVDSVITTPQSQWTPYQIAVANLNPDLKSRNKKYQSALNTRNILENEKVNLGQAWEIMMNAYKEAIDRTESAAERQMAANSAAAQIQAGWAISWMWALATNPAAAAQVRAAANNQAAIQNAQIRSNADQNIASLYGSAAQVPATLASMSATNAQIDTNATTADANANLANAQADYYNRPQTTSSSGSSSSSSSSDTEETTNETVDYSSYVWNYTYQWKDGKTHTVVIWNNWVFVDNREIKSGDNIRKVIGILDRINPQQ